MSPLVLFFLCSCSDSYGQKACKSEEGMLLYGLINFSYMVSLLVQKSLDPNSIIMSHVYRTAIVK